MNTTEWITDRLPTYADARRINATHLPDHELYGEVWVWQGQHVTMDWELVTIGTPWQPITTPAPYVEPKRVRVVEEQRYDDDGFDYAVAFGVGTVARHIPTREAAERIAAIYEEVIP